MIAVARLDTSSCVSWLVPLLSPFDTSQAHQYGRISLLSTLVISAGLSASCRIRHALTIRLQGSYSAAISTVGSFDNPALALQLYAARSHLALSQFKEASALLSKLPRDDLSVQAVTHLTTYLSKGTSVLDEMRDLLSQLDGENDGVVRPVAATALHLEGENGEALAVLSEGSRQEDQESSVSAVHSSMEKC